MLVGKSANDQDDLVLYKSASLKHLRDVERLQKEYSVSQQLKKRETSFFVCLTQKRTKTSYNLYAPKHTYISLAEFIKQQPFPIPQETFISIVLQLAQAVHTIHETGFIHLNLNSENTLIDTETQKVKLTDFSLSHHWRENSASGSSFSELISAHKNFYYISPEQCNSKKYQLVDYRADLYNLGVLFYHLLVQSTPFSQFKDKRGLILAHKEIIASPLGLRLENTHWETSSIDRIVQKLLEKNPDSRYSCANSLYYDILNLERIQLPQRLFRQSSSTTNVHRSAGCLTSLTQATYYSPPVQRASTKQLKCANIIRKLGLSNPRSFLKVSTSVFGVDREMREIISKYKSVIDTKQTTVVLIEGTSGLGKSTLAKICSNNIEILGKHFITNIRSLENSGDEEQTPIVARGKFEQINDAIPFTGVREALEQIFEQMLSIHGQATVIQALRTFMNDFTIQMLSDQLIPIMKDLFNIDCPVMILSSFENRTRLEDGLGRWMQAICSLCDPYPLVIVLDDLQWATDATSSLLKSMILNEHLSVLYLATYRPTAAEPENSCFPVHLFHKELEKYSNISLHHILLQEMQLKDTKLLIGDMLGTSSDLQSLCEVIQLKAQGNPFFINQFMAKIYGDAFLFYDHNGSEWKYEEKEIKKIPDSEKLVSVVQSEMKKLCKAARVALQIASCSESHFSVDLLSKIANNDVDITMQYLREAVYLGFIQPVRVDDSGLSYRFTHDKIHEAFYESIKKEDLLPFHMEIGRALRCAHQKVLEIPDNDLFTIATHLNIAKYLITSPEEQSDLLQLNLQASKVASASGSYKQALTIAQQTIEFLKHLYGDNYWQIEHTASLQSFKTICETQFLLHNFQESEEAFEIAIENTSNLVEQVEIGRLRMALYSVIGEFQKSLEIGVDLLNRMGANLTLGAEMPLMIGKLNELLQELEVRGGPECLLQLPRVDDEVLILFNGIASDIAPTSYLCNDFALYGMGPIISTFRALEKGVTKATCTAFSFLGASIQSFQQPSKTGVLLARIAWKLAQEYKNPFYMASTGIGVLIVSAFDDELVLSQSELIYEECVLAASQTHDINSLVYLNTLRSWYYESLGVNLPEALQIALQTFKLISSHQKFDSLATVQGIIFAASILMKNVCPPLPCDGITFISPEHLKKVPLSMSTSFYEQLMKAHYIMNQIELAQKYFTILVDIIGFARGLRSYHAFQFWGALVRLTFDIPLEEKRSFINSCAENLKIYNDVCSLRFQPQYLCIQAEIMRLENRNEVKIMELYEKSIAKARKVKNWPVAGICVDRFISFCEEQGLYTLKKGLYEQQQLCYEKYGATAKIALITQLETNEFGKSFTRSEAIKRTNNIETLDKISALITSGTNIKEMMKIVATLLFNDVKAERGYVFCSGDNIHCVLSWTGKTIVPGSTVAFDASRTLLAYEAEVPVTLIQQICTIPKLSKQFINKRLQEYMEERKINSTFCIALQTQGNTIGALYLESNLFRFDSSRSISLIQHVAKQLATVIEYNMIVSSIDTALERANERTKQLERVNQMKDQFVEAISNELKVPLGHSVELIEQLKRQNLDRDQLQICDMITCSASGLMLIINDIIDFQACQKNKIELTCSTFDLCSCLDECAQVVRDTAVPFNLITDDYIIQDFIVKGDKSRLKQVLLNLLSNALKFTEVGGVVLSAHILNPDELEKDEYPKLIEVIFKVKDSGIGIAKSQQLHLFQAFAQLDSSRTRKHSGTGLGLALSQKLVQALTDNESSIECISEVGAGSTFSFHYKFPLIQYKKSTRVTDEIPDKKKYLIAFISKNIHTQQSLHSHVKQLSFPFQFMKFESDLDLDMVEEAKKGIIVILDTEFVTNVSQWIEDFESKHSVPSKFIILVHTNNIQPQKNTKCVTLYCPLSKTSVPIAISAAISQATKMP